MCLHIIALKAPTMWKSLLYPCKGCACKCTRMQRVMQRTAFLHHGESKLHKKTGMKIILDVHFPCILLVHSVTKPLEKAERDYEIFHSTNR